jgi:hypothetical protein
MKRTLFLSAALIGMLTATAVVVAQVATPPAGPPAGQPLPGVAPGAANPPAFPLPPTQPGPGAPIGQAVTVPDGRGFAPAGPVVVRAGAPAPVQQPLAVFHGVSDVWNNAAAIDQWNREAPDPESQRLADAERRLNGEIHELAREYKEVTDAGKREVIQQRISERVGEQFDNRQQQRQKQLEALAAQLERLRATHTERGNQRDRIVADRVTQLVREADGLGWGDEGGPNEFRFGAPAIGPRAVFMRTAPAPAVPGRPVVDVVAPAAAPVSETVEAVSPAAAR